MLSLKTSINKNGKLIFNLSLSCEKIWWKQYSNKFFIILWLVFVLWFFGWNYIFLLSFHETCVFPWFFCQNLVLYRDLLPKFALFPQSFAKTRTFPAILWQKSRSSCYFLMKFGSLPLIFASICVFSEIITKFLILLWFFEFSLLSLKEFRIFYPRFIGRTCLFPTIFLWISRFFHDLSLKFVIFCWNSHFFTILAFNPQFFDDICIFYTSFWRK